MAKNRTIAQEYKHQRKLLEARVKSAEKAGFYFYKSPIPEAVKRPTKASINRLKALTGDTLRNQAVFIIKDTGEVVSGRRGQYLIRKEAGEKAAEARKRKQPIQWDLPEKPEDVPEEPQPQPPGEPDREREPEKEPTEPEREKPTTPGGESAEDVIFYTFLDMIRQMMQQASKTEGFQYLIDLMLQKWKDPDTNRTAFAKAIEDVVSKEPPDIRTGYTVKASVAYFNQILSSMNSSSNQQEMDDLFENDEDWELPF